MANADSARSKGAPAAGFSLMELIVVLAILGLLAALVGPRVMGALGDSKVKTTRVQLEQIGAALDYFMIDNGRYPTTEEGLESLIARPANLESWNGPYLAKSRAPKDGWNQSFVYEFGGRENSQPYRLYSLGADNREGGEGDRADISLD